MVKSIHTITIEDYSLFEKTGKSKYLCRFYLPFICDSRIKDLLIEISRNLSGQNESDKSLQKEQHKLKSVYRIQYLVTLYEATRNLLVHRIEVDRWLKDIGRKTKSSYKNLEVYIEKIETATGIKIKTVDDLLKLKNSIDFWAAKFKESFPDDDKKEGLTFGQIVIGVFSANQLAWNDKMKLSDFFEWKKRAELIANKIKDNGGN